MELEGRKKTLIKKQKSTKELPS